MTTAQAATAFDHDALLARARRLLRLDAAGALEAGASAMFPALDALLRLGESEVLEELADDGFLRGSAERYEEHVAPLMVSLAADRFEMGTSGGETQHFCGESPRHVVELSAFAISAVPVTNELFALFDGRRRGFPAAEASHPVVDVTWIEASLFALWVGCRLPTEAEWEFACGAESAGEWCCEDEHDLPRYAWFSENAAGVRHPVRSREPNAFGLFDMHGNVWEWCADTYEADYYGRSALVDPLNLASPDDPAAARKVCRGGSLHALAEMCRTRYRQYEPADFHAADLGFRLARRSRSDTEASYE